MNKIRRKWKIGIWSVAVTVLGIILALALVLVADRLTEKFGWDVDLTANDRYAISEESVSWLENLDQDVKITVLVKEEDMASGSYYMVQAYQNLLEYQRHSDRVELEFVDVTENPAFVSKYPDLDLGAYDILIESGENQSVLSLQDLYDYDTTGSQITASRVEQKVTGALMDVTAQDKLHVTVLNGYGEAEPDDLITLLEGNRCEVTQSSLLTEEIDAEAKAAVLYAPRKDLEESSVKKLSEWLDNNGEQGRTLFVFMDPGAVDLPNLEAFLEDWGLTAEDGYVFESSSGRYYDQIYYPVAQYAEEEYAKGFTSNDITIMALCRPVDVLFEEEDGYETCTLLDFSETSGTVTADAEEVTEDMVTGDAKGMVMSTHSWYGSEVTASNVVLSGSALAFTGSLVTGDTFANGEYILGVLSTLTGEESSLNIPAKDLTAATHTMTASQASVRTWGFMAGLPVIVLAAGVVVWLRRRHR